MGKLCFHKNNWLKEVTIIDYKGGFNILSQGVTEIRGDKLYDIPLKYTLHLPEASKAEFHESGNFRDYGVSFQMR